LLNDLADTERLLERKDRDKVVKDDVRVIVLARIVSVAMLEFLLFAADFVVFGILWEICIYFC